MIMFNMAHMEQLTLDHSFNAASGHLPDGFDVALKSILPQNDVLIWSDVNHQNSSDIYADLFSAERLQEYAKQNVTDIYLELLEAGQPFGDRLENGEITVQQFITEYEQFSMNNFLSAEDGHKKHTDLGNLIQNAAQMDPPIKIHFVQMENTAEQTKQLAQLEKERHKLRNKYGDLRDKFIDNMYKNDVIPSDQDLNFLFTKGLGNYFVSNGHPNFNIKQINDQFSGRVPDKILNDFSEKITDLMYNLDNQSLKKLQISNQFRIDNDALLSDKVADTRKPNGKVIIEHGAGHGGTHHNDLDEMLLQRGLTSTRVNVVYDPQDLSSSSAQDASEISYFPKTNALQVIDANNDGIINGSEGVEPLELPDPISNNSSNLIIKH